MSSEHVSPSFDIPRSNQEQYAKWQDEKGYDTTQATEDMPERSADGQPAKTKRYRNKNYQAK